jgi:hypothetical protein
MDAAMAKLYASQVAGRVSGLAVEWMGGMGFVREGLAEKFWRDSKIGAIYEGTSNIQYVFFILFFFRSGKSTHADSSKAQHHCQDPPEGVHRVNVGMSSVSNGVWDGWG